MIRKFLKMLFRLSLLAVFLSFPIAAQTIDPDVVPPPGTMIKAELATPLDSASAAKGDVFVLKILFATNEGKRVAFPQGTQLIGKVVSARGAQRDYAGFMTLALDRLEYPDGATHPVRGEMQFMSLKKDVVTEANEVELTLRGKVDESETIKIQSSASIAPPARNNDDVAHRDERYPDQQKSTGSFDLTHKKGRDLSVAAGMFVNVKILAPPAPPALAPAPPKTPQ